MTKRIWIIGASNGIGLALVKRWLEQGYFVIASARTIEQNETMMHLQTAFEAMLVLIDIDVTKTQSIEAAIARLLAYEAIDMWFYNVGMYESRAIALSDMSMFEMMMRSNYLGAINVALALLPHVKQLQLTRWVFNASLASYFGLPYSSAYASSKAALVTTMQSWQPELQQEGVAVQIINHGFVKTRLTDKNDFTMPQLMSSSDAARQIDLALKKRYRFEIVFPKALAFSLRVIAWLPYGISLPLMRKLLR